MISSLGFAVGKFTDAGLVREANEDSLIVRQPEDQRQLSVKGSLFAVADGLGGHRAGEMASTLATEMVAREYFADSSPDVAQSISRAIQRANGEIYERSLEAPARSGMASTFTAMVLRGAEYFFASVGDSRGYLLREGDLRQITQDHSLLGEQVRAGLLAPDGVRDGRGRNLLTRAVGRHPEVQVDVFEVPAQAGDTVLLCTDGLWGLCTDEEMKEAIANQPDPQAAVQSLVSLAKERGAPDNITAMVIHAFDQPGQPVVPAIEYKEEAPAHLQEVARPSPQVILLLGMIALLLLLLAAPAIWFLYQLMAR
ncbi:MAG: serine/threonine-protein phosphatase [Chloroflexi bacterium]|nr:serine/threonine-protein phosphatase [Chloroflexota bacterium]MBI5955486.1 serine/threonine-protein phosphatase [Chloroflexota bacterium]